MLTCKREYINTSLQLRTSRINGSSSSSSQAASQPGSQVSPSQSKSPMHLRVARVVCVCVRMPFDWSWLKLCTAQSHIKFNIQTAAQRGVVEQSHPQYAESIQVTTKRAACTYIAKPRQAKPSIATAVKGLALTASQTANIVDTQTYSYIWVLPRHIGRGLWLRAFCRTQAHSPRKCSQNCCVSLAELIFYVSQGKVISVQCEPSLKLAKVCLLKVFYVYELYVKSIC